MTKLSIGRGHEGPVRDPYSYDELNFTKDGLEVTLHSGFAEWIEINGKRTNSYDEDANIYTMFEEATGLTVKEFEKAHHRINHPVKCPKCKSKKRGYETGFPGESFEVCGNCGHILNTHFNESAIM